ncbi:MBL fold metallo-hydrolase [Natronobacterium gregoryi]|uniref:Rhodanese n=2 Tax=Natronobacterium gregoryi TaxID=44930 RepID=L0ALF5_NATGS|nr:rhodanese-like domain-containing protein [Natronobacterium gregoryi]AFZ74284.1 Zn-dependent hydrolase, glyoxylase [Natronobacterium gregoryi SP2]ELY63743.1 rhodanese [Natronobacterium gregoryi SP2]PLK22207.1 rhodanese [Natronobacterium gregoryi SP2]SFI52969.1 thiosulfate/3-mercaptopyruvate sulfurtransferase [Natronobacterium gregoryi]
MPETISAADLRDRIEANDFDVLFDTRAPEDYEDWRIAEAENVEYSGSDDELVGEFDPDEYETDDDVVVTCASGRSAGLFAESLEEQGFENVAHVENGMEEWSLVYDVVSISTERDDLEILQLQRRAKGCLGYLVGSKRTGKAALVDVTRATDAFESAAAERGYEIARVFDTHIHADHISAGRDLAEKYDVPYHLGGPANTRDPDYDFDGLEPNETVMVGDIAIKAVHTPGHTTGMTSYLVEDEALLTGDTLFVESIGRTELQFAGDDAKDGARVQYQTLQHKIGTMPDHVKILPGHFSVTDCGEYIDVDPGMPMFSTVGDIWAKNEIVQLEEDAFVEHMFDNLPSKPPNYEKVIETNLGVYEPDDEDERNELELGPNRCAATEDSAVADD